MRLCGERDRERKMGTVYAMDWIKSSGGFWKVSASWNGKPIHPVTNRQGDFLSTSPRKFTKE